MFNNKRKNLVNDIKKNLEVKDYFGAASYSKLLGEYRDLNIFEKELIAKSYHCCAMEERDKESREKLLDIAHNVYLNIYEEDPRNMAANETLAFSFYFGGYEADLDEYLAKPHLDFLLEVGFEYSFLPSYYLLQKSEPKEYITWIDFLLKAKDFKDKMTCIIVLENLKSLENHMTSNQKDAFYLFAQKQNYRFDDVQRANELKGEITLIPLRLPVTKEHIDLLESKFISHRSIYVKSEIAKYLIKAYLSPEFYNPVEAVSYGAANMEEFKHLIENTEPFRKTVEAVALLDIDLERAFKLLESEMNNGNMFAQSMYCVTSLNSLVDYHCNNPTIEINKDENAFNPLIEKFSVASKYGYIDGLDSAVKALFLQREYFMAWQVISNAKRLTMVPFTPEFEAELLLLESDCFRGGGAWDVAEKLAKRAAIVDPSNTFVQQRLDLIKLAKEENEGQ